MWSCKVIPTAGLCTWGTSVCTCCFQNRRHFLNSYLRVSKHGYHFCSVYFLITFGGCALNCVKEVRKAAISFGCSVVDGLVASILPSLCTDHWSLTKCTMHEDPEIALTTHPETFFNQKRAKVISSSHGNQWQKLCGLKFHNLLKRSLWKLADSFTTWKSVIWFQKLQTLKTWIHIIIEELIKKKKEVSKPCSKLAIIHMEQDQ